MNNTLSALTAFFAGVLSFASPCVLPLASSYLFFISGGNPETKSARHIVISAVFFIAGFSLVFISLSVLLYSFLFFLGGLNRIVTLIAGFIVILLGFNILFDFSQIFKKFKFLGNLRYDDSGEQCATCRPNHSILAAKEDSFIHPARRPKGLIGAFLAGLAFGAGWTPCVGAFLGGILLLASQSETLFLALIYLALYSAGLGVPFLIISVFWSSLLKRLYQFNAVLPVMKIISGVFLSIIGLTMASGRLLALNALFQKSGYALSQWAQSGVPGVQLIPACIFFLLALLPSASLLLKKEKSKPQKNIPLCIWSVVFFILGAANITGLLNAAEFISRWFTFSGL
ncbi:MAG: cytochrome c biogenesis CcdA family protein [Spirochaetaceae bacterium]|nr:cytochrome c biogenesis CcdA family protein [Spirochaetaceae bacterium]